MAKSPSFQFYPKDWLTDMKVMLMTPAEKGGYINLLAHAWLEDDCSLPDDDNSLALLSGLGEQWFNGSSIKVRDCFKKEGKKLFNKRLLKERGKQEEWRKKCSDAGRKSAESKKNKALQGKVSSTNVQPTNQLKGNSSSSVCSLQSSSSSSTSIKDIKTIPQQALRLAELLAELILKHSPKKNELLPAKRDKTLQRWGEDIDKLNRINGHPWGVIEKVIVWSKSDSFWQSNILSGAKLRKQFDQMLLQMNRPNNKGKLTIQQMAEQIRGKK